MELRNKELPSQRKNGSSLKTVSPDSWGHKLLGCSCCRCTEMIKQIKGQIVQQSLVINLPMTTVDNYSRTSLCGHSLDTSDTSLTSLPWTVFFAPGESPCIFSKLNPLDKDTR